MRQVSSKRKHNHAITCGYAFLISAAAKPSAWVQISMTRLISRFVCTSIASPLIERSEGRCARSTGRQLVDFSTTLGLVLSKPHDMA